MGTVEKSNPFSALNARDFANAGLSLTTTKNLKSFWQEAIPDAFRMQNQKVQFK